MVTHTVAGHSHHDCPSASIVTNSHPLYSARDIIEESAEYRPSMAVQNMSLEQQASMVHRSCPWEALSPKP